MPQHNSKLESWILKNKKEEIWEAVKAGIQRAGSSESHRLYLPLPDIELSLVIFPKE